MYKIFLVGVGPAGLTGEQQKAVMACGSIVVSDRHRPLVAEAGAELIPMTPLGNALAAVRERLAEGHVGVLASGDPLFFGIGRTLLAEFGKERLEIFPALSSLQLACARFGVAWDDAAFVSLHGRNPEWMVPMLLQRDKVFVLTDQRNSPDRIAREVCAFFENLGASSLLGEYRVFVGENLGGPAERLTVESFAKIGQRHFVDPNVMLVLRQTQKSGKPGLFGLVEDELRHSRGLITKDEVRAVTLHKLRLPGQGVFWDIGAGSGSVSIEAARLVAGLRVFAVEKNIEELENVKENIVRHAAFNVMPVAGEAPEALAGLPGPDRVFVGGSGGRLGDIIDAAVQHLPPGGRIVVNAVTRRTRKEAPVLLARNNLSVETFEIGVTRNVPHDPDGTPKVLNPITIMVGKK